MVLALDAILDLNQTYIYISLVMDGLVLMRILYDYRNQEMFQGLD